jgi:hypothetical protein
MQRCPACDHIQFVEANNCERCGAPLPATAIESADEIPGPAPGSLEAEVLQIAAQSGKISAIKRYREATNASLKDAKDAVESLMDRYRVRSPAGKSGCAGVLLLCAAGLASCLIAAWLR